MGGDETYLQTHIKKGSGSGGLGSSGTLWKPSFVHQRLCYGAALTAMQKGAFASMLRAYENQDLESV